MSLKTAAEALDDKQLRRKLRTGFTTAEIAAFFGIRRKEAICAALALRLEGTMEQLATGRWRFVGPAEHPEGSVPPHVSAGLVAFIATAVATRRAP